MIDGDTLEEGTRLGDGRYEIIHRLGRGGVATVYLARHTELSARVALKILSKKRAGNLDAVMRFRNEVQLVAGLPAHPNIVRPYEMGTFPELDGRPYMSMEYARGPTLGDLVLSEALDPAKACRLIIDVAEALCFLHGRGIIHRDVKPHNVIVTRDGGVQRAKLLDYGYAFDLHAFAKTGPEQRLTAIDERPGTKHYMAPEQARGEIPAPSFDIYALAVSLYELLVGDPPYHTYSPREVVLRKVDPTKPSFSIRGKRDDLPASLCALVDRGLEREPERRITSAAEFRDELQLVLAEMDGEVGAAVAEAPHPAGASTLAPRPQGSAWGLFAIGSAIAISLVLVSLLVAWLFLSESPRGATEGDPSQQDAMMSEHSREPPAPEPTPAESTAAESVALTHSAGLPEPAQAEPDADETTDIEAEPAAEAPAPPEPKRPPKRAVPRPEPEPKPAAEPKGPPCEDVRSQAEQAGRDRKWTQVLRLTGRRECWAADTERQRLRVEALFNLERYEQCAAFSHASSPDIQRTAQICETRLAEEQDQ